jgi:hypothetical protein
MSINARQIVGSHNILFMTLDTLRYDAAVQAHNKGLTPHLSHMLPESGWEKRHSPGNFTYAAHWAFFAGFLPTPAHPGNHPRLFAARFPGSETSTEETVVFDAPDFVSGLRQRGYHTICIGGVGFFNLESPLGRVLPGLFDEAHWAPELGVADPNSTENQVRVAVNRLESLPEEQLTFLFLNISAIHQPNYFYLESPKDTTDTFESHLAALAYVDSQLPPLLSALQRRPPWLCILCSDHGTAYGDGGYHGHRLAHPVVWNVPYTEFILNGDRP